MIWKISAVVVAVVGIGALLYVTALTNPVNQTLSPGPAVCPADTKHCADGSDVVRTGPTCLFADCPVPMASSTSVTTSTTGTPSSSEIKLRVGETGTLNSVSITPLEIISDSRCPADPKVQCIWAGTVQVRAKIQSGLGSTVTTLELDKEFTTEAESILLTVVSPAKSTDTEIATSTYQFTFQIKKR